MTAVSALFSDFYFWLALFLFALSVAGIFWILKSLQRESHPEEREAWEAEVPQDFDKTVRMAAPIRPAVPAASLESLAKQIAVIEETVSQIEKKVREQNSDQLNEMAGQMKLMVQMLKVIQGGAGSESVALVNQKVDKIYEILSSLSQAEQK